MNHREDVGRRTLLRYALALPAAASLAMMAPRRVRAAALEPTPACVDADEPTPQATEGPYFTPNSPERSSLLEPGMTGPRIILSGLVLTTDCRPVEGALLDIWHADADGRYDNEGYRLRGHQFTDADGRYRIETIVPGIYPGRTRHYHVKVQEPGKRLLTTQLFFPGEAQNEGDGIFDPALLLTMAPQSEDRYAQCNFML